MYICATYIRMCTLDRSRACTSIVEHRSRAFNFLSYHALCIYYSIRQRRRQSGRYTVPRGAHACSYVHIRAYMHVDDGRRSDISPPTEHSMRIGVLLDQALGRRHWGIRQLGDDLPHKRRERLGNADVLLSRRLKERHAVLSRERLALGMSDGLHAGIEAGRRQQLQ
jgi:hypothetical protein